MNRNLSIFGENSPVKLPEFFEKEIKEYGDLLPYFLELKETDIPLLESVRDWNGKVKVSERLKFLDKYLDLPRVKYMGMEWNEVTSKIAEKGDLEVLKYVHSRNCPWNKWTCFKAAENGHLNCLKFAHTHGATWDWDVCAFAARNGNLDCLKYAHTEGCPWNVWTPVNAAEAGQLECLKYAHTHGCYWDERVCRFAARNGRLECLKYAHSEGCPWDDRTTNEALLSQNFDCLSYASENDCPIDFLKQLEITLNLMKENALSREFLLANRSSLL